MGGYQIIVDINFQRLLSNKVYHQRWEENISEVAEVITLLELIIVIEIKGRHIGYRKIKIGFDNSKCYRNIAEKIYKLNTFVQDTRVEIAIIKRTLKQIKFKIEIYLEKGRSKQLELYYSNRLKYLIKECNKNTREIQENTYRNENKINLKWYGSYGLMHNENIALRSI